MTEEVKAVRQGKLRQLTNTMRQDIIVMFASGYTIRYIKRHLTAKLGREPTDKELMRITDLYSDDIERAREDIAKMAVTRGLASRSTRLLRLNVLAENWEERSESDPKAARVYLSALEQVRKETEHLNTADMENDPWAKLLHDLRDMSKRPTTSALPPGTPDGQQSTGVSMGTPGTAGTPPQTNK